MTSILEGAVQRGTAKKLRDLNLDMAGKLEQLIKILILGLLVLHLIYLLEFMSALIIPISLGKYELEQKLLLPILKTL